MAPGLLYDWNLDAHREITNIARSKNVDGVEASVQIEEQSIDVKELDEEQLGAVTNMVKCGERSFKSMGTVKDNSQ